MSNEEIDQWPEAHLRRQYRQYRDIKQRFSDTILLFSINGTYEIIADDVCDVMCAITGVRANTRCQEGFHNFPFVLFPTEGIESVISILISAGHKVAICEPVASTLREKKVTFSEPELPDILIESHALKIGLPGMD